MSEGPPAFPAGTALPTPLLARLQVVDGTVWVVLLLILALVTAAEVSQGGPETLVFALLPLLVPALFAAGHYACAAGLRRGSAGGRRLLALFSWLGLLRIPFGTVASVLTLAALRRARRPPAEAAAPVPAAPGRGIALFWSLWQLQLLGLVGLSVWVNVDGGTSRSSVKRTMGDLRSIATAVEAYNVDYDAYPPARSIAELTPFVSPTYLQKIPLKDAWNGDLVYQTSPDGKSYVIVSAGKDGKLEEADPWAYQKGTTRGYDADIVYRDGAFLRVEELPGAHDE